MPLNTPACEGCGIAQVSKVYVPIERSRQRSSSLIAYRFGAKSTTQLSCPIMIIVDRPDNMAMATHKPVSGGSWTGKAIAEFIATSGLGAENFVVTSLLHCTPQFDLNPESPVLTHCTEAHLIQELAHHKPRVVIAMGNMSCAALTGLWGGKKSKKRLDDLRGYAVPLNEDLKQRVRALGGETEWLASVEVIPTYSPTQLITDYQLFKEVQRRDLEFALNVAKGMVELDSTTDYRVGSAMDLFNLTEWLINNPTRPLSFDIETTESERAEEDKLDAVTKQTKILSIQFSVEPGTGWFFFWTPEIKQGFLDLLARTTNRLIGHYIWNFDLKVLWASEQIHIPILRTDDTLAMYWHYKPELIKSLGFVANQFGMTRAWKHTIDEQLVEYGCRDVDAALRIYNGLIPLMQAKRGEGLSLWEGYEKFVRGIRPILNAAELRGIPRNRMYMTELTELIQTRKAELEVQIQAAAPKEILPVKVYKTWPDNLKTVGDYVNNLWTETAKEIEETLAKAEGRKVLKKNMKVKASRPNARTKSIVGEDAIRPYEWESIGDEWQLVERARFSPNATEQLKRYLTYYGVAIPINLNGDETTGKIETEKQLERLKAVMGASKVSDLTALERESFEPRVTKDNLAECQAKARVVVDFIEAVFAYRKYNKAQSTYVDGEGWTPGADGRIHTTFTLSATATWQLSSLRPNVQNLTKGKDANDKIGTELGKALRQTLWAEPGHAIMEFDYSGCHILTMAELAGDRNYYRLGCVDAHSFLTSHMVRGTVERVPGNLQLYHKGASEEFAAWIAEIKAHLADIDLWPQLPDNELKAKLGWIKSRFKSLRDSQAKPAILGNQLGLGARKLYFLNDKSFNSIDEARELQALLRSLFPTIPVYQAAITTQAHRDGYLISRHGATRYFTNVKQYNPGTGQWSDGPSAKEVIAFYVQNGAFGIIREAMLKMEAQELMDKYEFINSVHDSLVFHPKIEDIEECYWNITRIMEQPSEHIVSPAFPDGLRLKVEASIGPTWRDIVEVGHRGDEILWPEWASKQLEARSAVL